MLIGEQQHMQTQRQQRLSRLAEEAQARFEQLKLFPTSHWDDLYWLYQGKVRIYLTVPGLVPELATLNKVFVTTLLWNARQRNKALGATRVKSLAAAFKMLIKVDVRSLIMIDQDAYDRTLNHIRTSYAHGEGLCNDLNRLMAFMASHQLLTQPIATIRVGAQFQRTDRYGRIAAEEKLPLPPLIGAIIQLKWALDHSPDQSIRAQLDRLAILTQVFQFGLGLRIGEVLRLPKNCLVERNGQLFCNVWTEKGAAPMARYIPQIWRPVIQDAVRRIDAICSLWRERASEIENGTLATVLAKRFDRRVAQIDTDIQVALEQLAALSAANATRAQTCLKLLKPLADEAQIELHQLTQYLPFASTAVGVDSLLAFYRRSGFDVRSTPVGRFKHTHYLVGADIKRRLNEMITWRTHRFTYEEVFQIIHGQPPCSRQVKSSAFQGLRSKALNRVEWLAFFGETVSCGRAIIYCGYDEAVAAIKHVVGGGFDYRHLLPLLDAQQLYPEWFGQKSMTMIHNGSKKGFFSYLRLNAAPVTFFRKSASMTGLKYAHGTGYLLEYHSITQAISQDFVALNTRLQTELIAEMVKEVLSEGLAISSSTFRISQKVSDYLFVVPSSLGGTYQAYIPCVLSYGAVLYALKPSDQGLARGSAFSRYGVAVEDEVIQSFQTHKGRHWQTNSLFRAGLAASIVNKWMGRTQPQGAHYDHQTARERAQKVGELMLGEHTRFLGSLPEQLQSWKRSELSLKDIQAQLNLTLQTAHYSPLGFCVRDINLKPCEYHLKCLTGNAGLGCREFVFDLHDPIQRQNITNERDKAEQELARLFEVLNRPDVPAESVEMHIEHQMTLFRNATAILERAQLIMTTAQAAQVQDFQPFRAQGSKPDDCAFQCGTPPLDSA
ncbi:hypothetical protein [Pseudomonas sp. Sample_22]|uniref:hypothetical protein n=1 Tax=Pseudomonas sp. Sample_22 TaxID=2448266 RepID=UPI0010327D59|nr:hypothetical protein [Pseudomonas sp. Sample_22]